MSYEEEKREIIYWAHQLREKGLVKVRSGNMSLKVASKEILITAHNSYLGYLEEEEILLTDLKGNILEDKGELTSEQALHLGIYNKFKDTRVVLHTHSPYTVAFFHYFDKLEILSFETKFYLGNIKAIAQDTPTVTEIEPVLSALENNNITVLKNHGVVAMGENFREAFSLIELLEEQAKVSLLIKRSIVHSPQSAVSSSQNADKEKKMRGAKRRYRMLSEEHAQKLAELVNNDKEARELGEKYDLTFTLAVKNQDKDEAMRFHYKCGEIIRIDNSEEAEFIIIGKEEVLRKVFNREIDPFVALTQGKVKAKGDFTRMSRWYPVMVRTFKLWEQAPVE